MYCSGSLEAEACIPVHTCDRHHAILFRSAGPFGGFELCYRLFRFHGHMTLCIAVIGTSDQSCWLAEACKILLLLLLFCSTSKTPSEGCTDVQLARRLCARLSLQTNNKYTFRAAPQTQLVTSACMLSSEFLCLDPLHDLLTYGSNQRAQGCFSLFFFRYKNFCSSSISCLCVHHS